MISHTLNGLLSRHICSVRMPFGSMIVFNGLIEWNWNEQTVFCFSFFNETKRKSKNPIKIRLKHNEIYHLFAPYPAPNPNKPPQNNSFPTKKNLFPWFTTRDCVSLVIQSSIKCYDYFGSLFFLLLFAVFELRMNRNHDVTLFWFFFVTPWSWLLFLWPTSTLLYLTFKSNSVRMA